MTALTLALVAAMAVGSDGTERISTETREHFMGNGYWEGVYQFEEDNELKTTPVQFEPGKASWIRRLSCRWIDEGRGECGFFFLDDDPIRYGIYRKETGKLIICFHRTLHRPTRIQCDKGHFLYILKPAKPPKK